MSLLRTLRLAHERGSTEILVGPGAVAAAARRWAPWLAGRTVFTVSSAPVRALHGDVLEALLAPAARRVDLEVPDGEAAKSMAVATGLWERMLAAGGKRDSRLVTFGGGSVGDLGGFVAGCFLRGIEVLQVPTTLLAQVDAAVGGKTGVDLPGGKNTVGVFHHPVAVASDTALLATLPAGELRSGMVEVIKMAALLDPALLAAVERDLPALLAGDAAALAPVVAAAAAAKVAVVERDAREAGERRVLNFGHTLGHALEAALGYRGLRHGEAVAYGMLFALRLAERRGLDAAEPALFARLRRLLTRLELPPLPTGDLDPADLVERLGRDKKAREGGLAWVLPAAAGGEAGEGRIVTGVRVDELLAELPPFLAAPFARVRYTSPSP
ncbi:MAG TPA: 3-dehydroquinate synthase [Thermoanaerobaculia bacterium]|nr:3-dehydroquinate synthase [Thermoanaerobaculia bacterium]